MANTTITNLPTVTALNGSEPLLGVQAGSSVQITTGQIASLAAGTSGLPFSVSSGGTGRSSFTTNGVVFGNGTSPLGVTAAGATGQVLIGNTGGAPTWSSTIPSTAGVTSLSLGTTGLTPASGTTGAITVGFGSVPTDAGIYSPASQQIALSTASTARLFIDASGNVGIGTTSPSALLTVSSIVPRLDFVETDGSSGFNTSTLVRDVDVFAIQTRTSAGVFVSNDYRITSNASGALSHEWRIANTERMRIDSTGNVGIGTASPTALLNVVSNSATDAVRITQTGAGNAFVVEDSANPDATPFVIDTNGTVVVGHTSALVSAYDIQSITTDGAGYVTQRYNNSTGGSFMRLDKSRSATIGTNTIVQNNDTLGSLEFRGDDGAAFIQSARILAEIDGTPGLNDMPGRLVFSTTADGASSSTERMRITSAGNVGIGTTTPASPLDVAGDASVSNYGSSSLLFLRRAAGTVTSPTAISASSQLGRLSFSGYDGTAYQTTAAIFATSDGAISSTDSAGRLIFQTTSTGSTTLTERLRIRSDGNIGVATAGSGLVNFLINNNITGGTTATAVQLSGAIQSGVTSNAYGFFSAISSAAAAFTTNNVFHFVASPAAGGAGSIITNQAGFRADASLATAGAATVTNAFGFSSGLTAAANSWNFYANGTANNAFAGNVRIGSVVAPTVALDVTGVAASTNWYNNATQTATNTATLSAAQITSPFLLGTPTATASYTLPLASAVDTALGSPPNETGWEFTVFTTAAFAITILTNTGWTLVGSMATGATANSFARFRARKTGTAAYTLYRIS